MNKPAGLTTMRHAEEADEFGPRGQRFLPKTLADLLPRLLGVAGGAGDPGPPHRPRHQRRRGVRPHPGRGRAPDAAVPQAHRRPPLPGPGPRHAAVGADRVGVRPRPRRRPSRQRARQPDGKRAVTHVKVLERLGSFALVECRLETGRTHQVRIHLGEAGAPLCGERVYDRPVNGKPLPDGSGADAADAARGPAGVHPPADGRADELGSAAAGGLRDVCWRSCAVGRRVGASLRARPA